MESLGYIMIYMLTMQLPWTGYYKNSSRNIQNINEARLNISAEELCAGCPTEIFEYMHYIMSLSSDSILDYDKCKEILNVKFTQKEYVYDYIYDWTIKINDYEDDSKSDSELNYESRKNMNQFSSTIRVNCPTNEGSMMLLLKANPEPEKAKQIYSKRKNKRALYISKNCVSEFDSNRILVQGQDFSYPVFHNNFDLNNCSMSKIKLNGISIKKSKCIKKDQMISSNFISIKAMKSKKSICDNDQNLPQQQKSINLFY